MMPQFPKVYSTIRLEQPVNELIPLDKIVLELSEIDSFVVGNLLFPLGKAMTPYTFECVMFLQFNREYCDLDLVAKIVGR